MQPRHCLALAPDMRTVYAGGNWERLQQRSDRHDDLAVGANAEREPGCADHADERVRLELGPDQPEDHANRDDLRCKRLAEPDERAELQHLADVDERYSVDPGPRDLDAE